MIDFYINHRTLACPSQQPGGSTIRSSRSSSLVPVDVIVRTQLPQPIGVADFILHPLCIKLLGRKVYENNATAVEVYIFIL